MNFSKHVISGRVGKDPEMKTYPNGTQVAKISVAVNKKEKGKDTTVWYNVSCFNKLSEIAMQYVKKGSVVYAEGSLGCTPFQSKTGELGVYMDLSCNVLHFLNPAKLGGNMEELHEPQKKYEKFDNSSFGGTNFGKEDLVAKSKVDELFAMDDMPF